MSIQQNVSLPVQPTVQAVNWPRRILLIILIVLALFGITYGLAWYNSFTLGSEFFRDAEMAYSGGHYLNALAGYEVTDSKTNTRTQYSGYYQVIKLWGSQFAVPKPDFVAAANQKIQDIIQNKLDINSAESFIQQYTGRNHPLFPDIYLRLGELYEASGDVLTAKQIYKECTTLFPTREDIVQAANEKLTQVK